MSPTDTPIDPPPPATAPELPGRPPVDIPDQPAGDDRPQNDPSTEDSPAEIAADDVGASAMAERKQEASS